MGLEGLVVDQDGVGARDQGAIIAPTATACCGLIEVRSTRAIEGEMIDMTRGEEREERAGAGARLLAMHS